MNLNIKFICREKFFIILYLPNIFASIIIIKKLFNEIIFSCSISIKGDNFGFLFDSHLDGEVLL